jgi:hypothetical protein
MRLEGRILADLAESEKRIIDASKAAFEGDFGHWTVLDTVNHACSWKNNALKKVEARIRGEDASYHSGSSLEDVNRHYYDKAKGASKAEALATIDATLARAAEVLRGIEGRDSSAGLAPTGYGGSVSDYLTYDLIIHPINHYAYYAIRNDEYDAFLEVERYVSKYRSSAFKDMSVIDIKGFADEKLIREIFDRGYEWRHDDLFILLKSMAAP